jgi:desulfoferrodoxin (superoxide reductase-like protein)
VALVTAAALAAGASPAYAASLEKTVTSIEKENVSEVNTKGAPEKHLPQVTLAGTTVEVVVPHVMDPEKPHFIEYVWLKDIMSGKVVAVQSFAATDASPPTLTASVASGTTVKPLLYCNLHGLWEGESLTV